ncbi:MAG: hypothetical protein EA424_11570 [Planctomycetaceae bacterium]|nr:MAG: hypothetical protein EA424_11570 [Planctomycetaceae bacterium]
MGIILYHPQLVHRLVPPISCDWCHPYVARQGWRLANGNGDSQLRGQPGGTKDGQFRGQQVAGQR